MKSYRDLNIYREAHRLAIEIHRISLQLPKFEGYGRKRYKAEFIRYLTYAHTECDETIEHLDYLFETKSLTDKEGYETVRENYTGLSKQINKFIDWVENNWNNYPSAE